MGFKGFGPEPLEASFTARRFRADLRRRKGRLKPLLLDQTFLAGVGNIYADEALWAARLHPLRSASSLRPADEGRLYREIRRILAEAVERRGSSVDDYTAPDGDGSMQDELRVYQRAGEPCFRCGRPVRRIVIGARSTHFCSWCQRLPVGEQAGAAAILRGIEPRPGAAPAIRTGPRWTEIGGGDGSLGIPTGSTRRAAGARSSASGGTSESRSERTKRAAATRRAAARAVTGARPDMARGA
jgi:hypothetical protein